MSRPVGPFVLFLRHVVAAPRERVFDAMIRPDDLARWWGPRLFTTPEIELDLRVGGRYRFTMQPPDGDRFHVSGEFLEVTPPSALAYTFRWDEPTPDDRETVVTLTLADAGGATELSLRQGDFATDERLALHRSGWNDSLDKLSALLAAGR
ncbi:SRPBCC domain-containing protein [Blastococcus sp. CT_GayMR16]|uniref:SRPBCC family protein n=1 Tax=Blastococcus sp. CT_GayMR16 TaxID=2559607 RepID=UPI0010741814|nr:SRPBCC domain-containing protein [Blastococcus sp. CT_GayMR16]TFV85821.1 SRPBCC domain-containing protein [Blastococcus sp. CT_GayMR16]